MRGRYHDQDAEVRPLVALVGGREREVVEVRIVEFELQGNQKRSWTSENLAEPFYLDDIDGDGWFKVTTGDGSRVHGEQRIAIEGIVRERPGLA